MMILPGSRTSRSDWKASVHCVAGLLCRRTRGGVFQNRLTFQISASANGISKAALKRRDSPSRRHDHTDPEFKPHTAASNAKELYFDKLDSVYLVATAGSREVGRSDTIKLPSPNSEDQGGTGIKGSAQGEGATNKDVAPRDSVPE